MNSFELEFEQIRRTWILLFVSYENLILENMTNITEEHTKPLLPPVPEQINMDTGMLTNLGIIK